MPNHITLGSNLLQIGDVRLLVDKLQVEQVYPQVQMGIDHGVQVIDMATMEGGRIWLHVTIDISAAGAQIRQEVDGTTVLYLPDPHRKLAKTGATIPKTSRAFSLTDV